MCADQRITAWHHIAWLTLSSGLWATFCPCVIYGQNRQRLRHLQRQNVPLPGGGDRINHDCRVYCCMAVPCFYWVFQVCWGWPPDSTCGSLLRSPLRWAVARTSATAIAFAERAMRIASALCFVPRVRLRRSAGSLSWRRGVSRKAFLRTCWITSPES